MRVTFYAGSRKAADGGQEECDCVSIHTGRDGKDVVHRVATEADKARWPSEYAAFVDSLAAPSSLSDVVDVALTAPLAPSTKKLKSPKG